MAPPISRGAFRRFHPNDEQETAKSTGAGNNPVIARPGNEAVYTEGMSEADVALVRQAVESFGRNDRDSAWGLWAADGTMNAPKEWPEAASSTGLDQIRRVFDGFDEAFGPNWPRDMTAKRFTDSGGGRVLVEYDWRPSGAASGASVDQQISGVYTVRDGRIIHADFFTSHEEGRKAAGLE